MPFPNLPHWVDGEFKLAETVAVHQYLAAKYQPELLGRDSHERGIVRMIENVTRSDFNEKITGLMYGQDDAKVLEDATLEGIKPIEKYLNGKQFLAGKNVTYADFIFFEILDKSFWASNNKLAEANPNCVAYHKRVSSLPGLKEYFASNAE